MDALILSAYLLSTGAADAQQDPVYNLAEDPWVSQDRLVVGVFRHAEVGLDERTQLDFTGLSSLPSPDLAVERQLWTNESMAASVSGGLSVPTYGLRLMQGLPLTTDEFIPWVAIVSAGGSVGWRNDKLALSAGLVARYGQRFQQTPAGMNDFTYTELPWLDPMLTPIIDRYSVAGLVGASWTPGDRWQVDLDGRVVVPAGPDLNLRLMAWRGLGERSALGFGAVGAREVGEGGPMLRAAPRLDWQISL